MTVTNVSARPVGHNGGVSFGFWNLSRTSLVVGAVALVALGVLAVVWVVKWVWSRGAQPQQQRPQPRLPAPPPPLITAQPTQPPATPPAGSAPKSSPATTTQPTASPPPVSPTTVSTPLSASDQKTPVASPSTPTISSSSPSPAVASHRVLTDEDRTVIKQLIPLFNSPVTNGPTALALKPAVADLHPLEFLRAIVEDQSLWLPMGDVASLARTTWESELTQNLVDRKLATPTYQPTFIASARQHFSTVATLNDQIQKLETHIAKEDGAALLNELSNLIFLTEKYAFARLEALIKELSSKDLVVLWGIGFEGKLDAFEKQADEFYRTIALVELYRQKKLSTELDDIMLIPDSRWFPTKKSKFLDSFRRQTDALLKPEKTVVRNRILEALKAKNHTLDENTIRSLHEKQETETLLRYFLTGVNPLCK